MPSTGDTPEPRDLDKTATAPDDAAESSEGGNGAAVDEAGQDSGRPAGTETEGDHDGGADGPSSTLAQRRQRAARAAAAPRRGGWAPMAKRYGPFVAVVVIVAAAIAVFSSGGGGSADDEAGGGGGGGGDGIVVPGEAELARSGPMTPQRAELEGRGDVDYGSHCDTDTGRLMLPTVYAPPCVEPFRGDNGGATSTGVTGDEVLIIRYTANTTAPGAEQGVSALLNAGADLNPETMARSIDGYVRLYNEIFETYGRTVRVEEFVGTGASNDRERARADAVEIAEREPFMVIGGPWESGNVFATELAERGVICGPGCTLAQPDSLVEDYFPYMWLPGPTLQQAADLLAEMISKLAGPGPAEMAGDRETQQQERTYALLHYDTPDGDFTESFEVTVDALEREGITLETDIEFELNLTTAQEDARTIISRLKGAGVTTVIYSGDPLTPRALTAEATAQDYWPEWIIGPTIYGELAILGRMFDGEQWSNGFGLSWFGARTEPGVGDSSRIYEWAYGEEIPNRTALLSEGAIRWVFQAIHLAGPNLTPESVRDSLFRYPPTGGGPTAPLTSWGDHGVWDEPDLGITDDLTLLWWDPDAPGEDEMSQQGRGMYRYARGGARYQLGEIPDSPEEAGLFDPESSATMYEERPDGDVPPDYPPPDLSD